MVSEQNRLGQRHYWSGCCSASFSIFWLHPGSERIESDVRITSTAQSSAKPGSTEIYKYGNHEIIELARKVARQKRIDENLFIKIMLRESGANPYAVGDINNPRKGCRSRGLFQINSCYWPEIDDKCAFDPRCNINWAADRFREGRVELFTSFNRK